MARVVGGVEIEIRGDDAHFERTMRDVRAEAGRTGQTMTREFRGAGNEAGKLKSQIMGTTSAFVGLAAVVTSTVLAGAITRAADEFAQMRSKINLSISAADDLLAVEKQLYQQAVANRAALEPTVALYQRLRGARADLTNEQTLAITDRWSKTLVISGASAQGAAAATLQFSQAIAGGVLRAEEFNSIIENNIRFVKVLADSLGVSVGDIRNLVNQGAITTETIFKALLDNSGALEAEFTKIPVTVNSAMVNVANAFTSYIGQADQASGTSAALAGFINSVASDFERLADIVIVAAATVGGAVAGLAAARVVGGLYALATASGTATGALVALRGALTLIAANPVTLVITALAGAFAYMAVTSSDAEGALARANVALENSRRILAETNTLVSGENNPFAQISTQAEGAAGQVAKLAGVLEELQQGLANLREEGQIANLLRLGEARNEIASAIADLERQRDQTIGRAANLRTEDPISARSRAAQNFDQSEAGKKLLELRQQLGFLELTILQQSRDVGVGDLINQFRNGSPDAPAAAADTPAAITAQAVATGELADETERLAAAQAELDGLLDDADGVFAKVRSDRDAATEQRVDEFNLNRAQRDREAQKIADAAQEMEDRIAASIARGLEEGIRSGNWGEALRGVLAQSTSDALSEAINDLAGELVNIFKGAFSGAGNSIGSFVGSLFGGGRAAGGSVRSGMRYMVGEQGPEMFVPSVPGMIVPRFEGPASAAAGGVQGRAGITIAAPFIVQGSITEEVLPRVQAMMAAQARELPRIVDARVSDSLRRGRY